MSFVMCDPYDPKIAVLLLDIFIHSDTAFGLNTFSDESKTKRKSRKKEEEDVYSKTCLAHHFSSHVSSSRCLMFVGPLLSSSFSLIPSFPLLIISLICLCC